MKIARSHIDEIKRFSSRQGFLFILFNVDMFDDEEEEEKEPMKIVR